MSILALGKHVIWSRSDGRGGTITYSYYDGYTWAVAALALIWLTWYLVSRYLRARAMKRPRRRDNRGELKRIAKTKSELSSQYLRPGFSTSIHAVGVGILPASSEYCIQVFVTGANEELGTGAAASPVPDSYRGVPVVLIEMPAAGFLSDTGVSPPAAWNQYPNGIREHQDVIIGGISGANTNLSGQSGTIGYFCTRRSKLRRRKDIHLLSNSHVFADLRKTTVDDGDLIMQPSPGEPASNRPIGTLINFSALNFDDIEHPNHVDAAIAKLWDPQPHNPVIPLIGPVKGYVETKDIELGEAVRKFGRTTGYTEGNILSIYLDIWIRYDRTGQSAFFQDQILIEPDLTNFTKFVSKGDSGSLVVDARQHAIGLIFAGMSEAAQSAPGLGKEVANIQNDSAVDRPKRIEGYGVANPISEVLNRLKIELLI